MSAVVCRSRLLPAPARCAQPLLAHLGLNATARASFAFYNTDEDVDRFLESLSTLRERMGYGK